MVCRRAVWADQLTLIMAYGATPWASVLPISRCTAFSCCAKTREDVGRF
jgi:hypothetical protein